eukprot:9467470-Pyramimonas_sp.AAC.3
MTRRQGGPSVWTTLATTTAGTTTTRKDDNRSIRGEDVFKLRVRRRYRAELAGSLRARCGPRVAKML